ncbi:MAG: aspartate carbamoyltransferase regulatory subunit [Candidatus Aenigmatarchaeota archaeon]
MSEQRIVTNIENGTVIDHIPAGKGLKVFEILKLGKHGDRNVILINTFSKKMGRKDVIKVENKEMEENEINKIALVAPNATVSIIKNWEVVEKKKVVLPDILENVLTCPNKNCITNSDENVKSKFIVEKKEPLKLRCWYCERIFGIEEIL